jgi:hypothetical protein
MNATHMTAYKTIRTYIMDTFDKDKDGKLEYPEIKTLDKDNKGAVSQEEIYTFIKSQQSQIVDAVLEPMEFRNPYSPKMHEVPDYMKTADYQNTDFDSDGTTSVQEYKQYLYMTYFPKGENLNKFYLRDGKLRIDLSNQLFSFRTGIIHMTLQDIDFVNTTFNEMNLYQSHIEGCDFTGASFYSSQITATSCENNTYEGITRRAEGKLFCEDMHDSALVTDKPKSLFPFLKDMHNFWSW